MRSDRWTGLGLSIGVLGAPRDPLTEHEHEAGSMEDPWRIVSLKRMTIPKVAVLVMGLTAAVLVATINPAPAQAYPNKSAECIQCHGTGTVAGTVTAVPSTTTPAAGATYTVLITPRQTRLLPVTPGSGSQTRPRPVPLAPRPASTAAT